MKLDSISPLVGMVEKLALYAPVSVEDRVGLLELPYSSRFFEAGSYLLRDRDTPDQCGMLVSGLAYRHKVSAEGLRQIVSIYIPGEFYSLQQLHLATADSNVQTLTRCEVVMISHEALRRLAAERFSVAQALFATTIVELSMSREWMLNIGRRDARTRIAHLLCEFAFRLDKHSLPAGQAYELPMTQEQLADALGLTAVHVNRTLKVLVNDGLIAYSKRGMTIPNWDMLVAKAGFNSRYLHTNLSDTTTHEPCHA